jgi:hypothetical protein
MGVAFETNALLAAIRRHRGTRGVVPTLPTLVFLYPCMVDLSLHSNDRDHSTAQRTQSAK